MSISKNIVKKFATLVFVAGSFLSASAYAQAATQQFSVTWSAVPTATKYQLETKVDTGAVTVDTITGDTSKLVSKTINTGQKFAARVRACDATWCGDWSTEASLVMPAKPATPSILGIQLIVTP